MKVGKAIKNLTACLLVGLVSLTCSVGVVKAEVLQTEIAQTEGTQADITQADSIVVGDLEGANRLATSTQSAYSLQTQQNVNALASSVGVKEMVFGINSTYVIDENNTLWGWGSNLSGQLGVGSGIKWAEYPIKITENVKKVSTSNNHTLILKTDGSVWACGYNTYGQVGNGTKSSNSPLVRVMQDVDDIYTAMDTSFAITYSRALYGWGSGLFGLLGNDSRNEQTRPILILSSGVKSIYANPYFAIATKYDNTLWAWGDDYAVRNSPVPQILYDNVKDFTVCGEERRNKQDIYVLKNDGIIYSRPFEFLTDVASLGSNENRIFAIKSDSSLWAWGENSNGSLGDGTDTYRSRPVEITTDVKSVVLNGNSTYILKNDDSLWVCGDNQKGNLGDGTKIDQYFPVEIMKDVKTIKSRASYGMIVIKKDNSLCSWGAKYVGDGTETENLLPVQIMKDVNEAYGNYGESYAIKNDGSIWGWGSGYLLGGGSNLDSFVPIPIQLNGIRPSTKVTGIEISEKALSLSVKSKAQLKANILPVIALNKNVTWSSDKNSVATVDSNGYVTAISKGKAIITVKTKEGGFRDSCTVTVTASETEIPEEINPPNTIVTLSAGRTAGTIKISLKRGKDKIDYKNLEYAVATASDLNYATWNKIKTSTIDNVTASATKKVFLRVVDGRPTEGVEILIKNIKQAPAPTKAQIQQSPVPYVSGMVELYFPQPEGLEYRIVQSITKRNENEDWKACPSEAIKIAVKTTDKVYVRIAQTEEKPASLYTNIIKKINMTQSKTFAKTRVSKGFTVGTTKISIAKGTDKVEVTKLKYAVSDSVPSEDEWLDVPTNKSFDVVATPSQNVYLRNEPQEFMSVTPIGATNIR